MRKNKSSKKPKLTLALSCFMPLYMVFMVKHIIYLVTKSYVLVIEQNETKTDLLNLIPNIIGLIIFSIAIIMSICGIIRFKKFFSFIAGGSEKDTLPAENVTVVKAENITDNYYFAYFSMFVLSFFTVDITHILDFCIVVSFILLILIVYMKNDMYFINPMLNIIGYKSFKLICRKSESFEEEVLVFTKCNLLKKQNQEIELFYNSDNFTVCAEKKDSKKTEEKAM